MLRLLLFSGLAAAATTTTTVALNDYPPQPQSTACGEIVNDNLYGNYSWFYAASVIDCLTSIPFNAAVATRFITYYNQTLQFQSTTAYLENPPAGYQRPPFDIQASLHQIQDRINSGYYHNQYAFEADLQHVSLYMHDSHAYLYVGALAQFTFSIPYYLISASKDGKGLPEVYVWDDINRTVAERSPLNTVNGVPVVQWLESFGSQQSFGLVEANADYNQLMVSPAQLVVGSANPLTGGATFYPGDDIEVTYKNGTAETWYWLAYYNSPGFTGPLATGGDFYNFFVLGLPPANYEETLERYNTQRGINTTASDTDFSLLCENYTSWNYISAAYPADTMTHQVCLGQYSAGVITSYYYKDISTAVLSIPTFDEPSDNIGDFSQAIIDFINNSTQRQAKNVIIDLQQNGGGQIALAFEVFRQFFPNTDPYAGSRMRSHYLMNEFGTTQNAYYSTLTPDSDDFPEFEASEFVATDRINAETEQNFTSWRQFYGPLRENEDTFSRVERYNLSNYYFVNYALGINFPDCYYDNICDETVPFAPSDIVLLTDGTCASTCSLFVEMMTELGVRSVVVGGQPQTGPMQTASGSRGARAYSSDLLDNDASRTQALNASAARSYVNDTGMVISFAGVNLRDQIKPNNSIPTQFQYLPADCRIFWSLSNVVNYTRLWHDAWNGIYGDTSICVPGSTNAKAPTRNATQVTLPETKSISSPARLILQGLGATQDDSATIDAVDGNAGVFTFCDTGPGTKSNSRLCKGIGEVCRSINFPCSGAGGRGISRFVCAKKCTKLDSTSSNSCPTSGQCDLNPQDSVNGGANTVAPLTGTTDRSFNPQFGLQAGRCRPVVNNRNAACSIFSKPGIVPSM